MVIIIHQAPPTMHPTPPILFVVFILSLDRFSLALSILDTATKNIIRQQHLNRFGIETDSARVLDRDNSGALYVEQLSMKIETAGAYSKGFHVPLTGVKMEMPGHENGSTSSFVEYLDVDTQLAINRSDAIVSCTHAGTKIRTTLSNMRQGDSDARGHHGINCELYRYPRRNLVSIG